MRKIATKLLILSSLYLSIVLPVNQCVGQTVFPEPPTAKKFSKDIAFFDSLNNTVAYPPDAVLFTGSSSIKRWKTIGEDLPEVQAVNRGFGGSRIEDLAFFLPTIIANHPWKAIVIMVGSNNLTGGTDDMSIDSIWMYTKWINQQIRLRHPEVPVFWIGITPTWSRIRVIEKIRQMNARWKNELILDRSIFFIDTFDRFVDKDGKPILDLFLSDQLHLNREGYRIWGEIIGASLQVNGG